MDEETLKAEIETFFVKANTGDSDRKKLKSRLPKSISFLHSLGVELDDIPTATQIKQLEDYLNTLTYCKGKNGEEKHYVTGVIRDWISKTVDFYNIRNGNSSDDSTPPDVQIAIPEFDPQPAETTHDISKGNTHMTITEKITPAEDSAVSAEPVQPSQAETAPFMTAEQPEPLSPVDDFRKPGRPKSTNRSAKFTLYMTPALWKDMNILADLDEITLTDLMNEALEYYCENSRKDDLEFLYGLERIKQEHRRQKARH